MNSPRDALQNGPSEDSSQGASHSKLPASSSLPPIPSFANTAPSLPSNRESYRMSAIVSPRTATGGIRPHNRDIEIQILRNSVQQKDSELRRALRRNVEMEAQLRITTNLAQGYKKQWSEYVDMLRNVAEHSIQQLGIDYDATEQGSSNIEEGVNDLEHWIGKIEMVLQEWQHTQLETQEEMDQLILQLQQSKDQHLHVLDELQSVSCNYEKHRETLRLVSKDMELLMHQHSQFLESKETTSLSILKLKNALEEYSAGYSALVALLSQRACVRQEIGEVEGELHKIRSDAAQEKVALQREKEYEALMESILSRSQQMEYQFGRQRTWITATKYVLVLAMVILIAIVAAVVVGSTT